MLSEQLLGAIRATIVVGPTSYSWFGDRVRGLPPTLRRGLPSAAVRNYLLTSLQARLYTNFYCTGGAVRAQHESASGSLIPDARFLEQIAEANTGTGCFDPGWRVLAERASYVAVVRGGLQIRIRAAECACHGNASSGAMMVCLRLPNALRNASPGYYLALGNKHPSNGSADLLRLYWHVRSSGAAKLMHLVTRALNAKHVPFRFKVLKNESDYTRCDSAVLYISRADYKPARPLLEQICWEIERQLHPRTPVFTKVLAPGLGLAEQPPSGNSFGMERCRVLAQGIIQAYELRRTSHDERLQVVLQHFERSGVSSATPYLNPGSADSYDPPFSHRKLVVSGAGFVDHADSFQLPGVDKLLRTAELIGQRLCKEALWHRDRCNWLGLLPSTEIRRGWTFGSLGPELYDGTSGVTLFLAELHTVSPDAAYRRTALGAVRHAIAHVEVTQPSHRIGLYTGWTGIAYAAVYIGLLLSDQELVTSGAHLAARVGSEAAEGHEFDVIAGRAGALLGLLALYRLLADESLLEGAAAMGNCLVATAQVREAGCSWPSPGFRRQRDLVGYSHGTAGVASALVQLHCRTGAVLFEQTARRAFEYERYWFDPDKSNWPDFRGQPPGKTAIRAVDFPIAWCHGAAGVALSRLHALRILGDEEFEAEALIALNTTRRSVEAFLNGSEASDFCLCHGLCGNAEVLVQGELALGDKFPSGKATALRVAAAGIERYSDGETPWPCGPDGNSMPGLMIGLSGIGHFYLRLHSAAVPSVLDFACDGLAKRSNNAAAK
jgi:class II lanthipeptide synthase